METISYHLLCLSSYKAGKPSIARAREESDNIFNEYNSFLSKFSNCEDFEIFPSGNRNIERKLENLHAKRNSTVFHDTKTANKCAGENLKLFL